MLTYGLRAVAILALLTLAISGCGSGKRSIDNRYYRGAPVYPPSYYGTLDPYYESTHNYRYEPLVRFPSTDTRLAPRSSSEFLNQHLSEFSGAFGGNFAQLHQQLPFGYTNINHMGYLLASPNVARVPNRFDPQRPSLALVSDVNTVSFVTYGLLGPSTRQRLLSVDVTGDGSFALGSEHGLYVGVRQFSEPRYYWYGPFKAGEDWHALVERSSTYRDGSAAYVTLAVFNGDTVRVDGLGVDVGS